MESALILSTRWKAMEQSNYTLSQAQLDELLARAVAAHPPGKTSLTPEELESITTKAITGAFVAIGIDAENALEMQQDFAFIRRLREGTESMKNKALITVVGTMIAGLFTLVGLGIKSMWSK